MYIFMITCLFYSVLLIQPYGCKNPINDDDDDDDDADDESTDKLY